MINHERKNQILKIVGQTGYATVNDLAAKMYTSPSTIRRNLTELENQGFLKRIYGGAELNSERAEAPMKLRYKKNHKEKVLIAHKAAEYLQDNTVIFIDGSSTCLHMMPFIKQHKNITVYTNSVEICSQLAQTHVTVYCLGGLLIASSLAFAGEYALQMVKTLYFDAMFFSCSAFCNDVITDYSESEAHLRRALIQQSKQQFFLCDSSKNGKQHNYVICNRADVTNIITD